MPDLEAFNETAFAQRLIQIELGLAEGPEPDAKRHHFIPQFMLDRFGKKRICQLDQKLGIGLADQGEAVNVRQLGESFASGVAATRKSGSIRLNPESSIGISCSSGSQKRFARKPPLPGRPECRVQRS